MGSGPSARETDITVQGLAVTPEGDIYFLDGLTDTLARIDGEQIEVVYTRGREVVRGGLAAGPDGSVYWFGALERGFQLKRYKDGNVATLAGTTELDPTDPDGFSRAAEAHDIPATEASISPLGPPAITGDGTIYFGTIWDVDDADPDEDEDLEPVIKRIGEAFPNTLNGDEALLA